MIAVQKDCTTAGRELQCVKTILHIIYRDKFTSGYIDFMNMRMNQYQHQFLVLKEGFPLETEDADNIFWFDSYSTLLSEEQYRWLFSQADAVVVSGVFVDWGFFRKLSSSPALLRKTVFHFWGGDFYRYRMDEIGRRSMKQVLKDRVKMHFIAYCFRNCRDIVFLIPGDYDAFRSVFGFSRSHSIAKMPGSPEQKRIQEFRTSNAHEGIRIILGNSATDSNCHEEILRILHDQYYDEAIEVYCPLSYGDEEYRNRINRLGDELLGEKYIPMTEYMDKNMYMEFLSGCDIGIFNNNRQQGMGNIKSLLALGKKVYIRTDTSMWEHYNGRGYTLFPAEGIRNLPFDEFVGFPSDLRENNMRIADEGDPVENSLNAWEPLLRKAVMPALEK
ncbi:MAG: TDP-N-acetylfucosamine:lipid II N-acetylfucosaminyltransferase [Solobacterium sp.]|nr:TDP-N-acetylfucosamine:lipid II N-acetylfucosaminyltransferase [Solobacterium sp.]